jgi:hypothetical protein
MAREEEEERRRGGGAAAEGQAGCCDKGSHKAEEHAGEREGNHAAETSH